MRRTVSNMSTVRDKSATVVSSPIARGVLRKSVPPKYTISICIAVINDIIVKNALLRNSPENINILSLLAVKELTMPAKINKA